MRKNTTFPKDVEDRLLEYRKYRKSQSGKLMFRETAIVELLRVALTNFEPPKPVEDRLGDIERRLFNLETDRVQSARFHYEQDRSR